MILEQYIPNNKVEFISKVRNISNLLGISPDWLMAVMYKESGLKPTAYNSNGGATGLIQFMPATAVSLGTSTNALKTMSNVQQLDYVYKYFKGYAGRIKSYADLYMITFFPIAVGKPLDWILQTSTLRPDIIAKYNPNIDLNHDNKISVGEFAEYALKGFTGSILELLKKKA